MLKNYCKVNISLLLVLFLFVAPAWGDLSNLAGIPARLNNLEETLLWPDNMAGLESEDFKRGVNFFKDGEYIKASTYFNKVIRDFPGTTIARLSLLYTGSIYRRTGRAKHDRTMLLKALKIFKGFIGAHPHSPYAPSTLIATGLTYMDMDRFAEARGTFHRVIKEFPKNMEKAALAQYLIGISHEKEGKYRNALFEYRIHSIRYPEYLRKERTLAMARILTMLNQYDEAYRFFNEALKKWPAYLKGDPGALFYYSECAFQKGDLNQARQGFMIFYNLYPENGKAGFALTRIGDTYILQKKYETSEKIYRDVIKLFPGTEPALISKLRLGDILLITSKDPEYKKALRYFKEVESSGHKDLYPLARYRIGKVKEARGHIKEAIKIYLEVYKNADKDLAMEVKNALDKSMRKVKEQIKEDLNNRNYIEVVRFYQELKGYEKYISAPDIYIYSGDAYKKLLLYEDAISAYEKVIDEDINYHKKVLYKLGELYEDAGEHQKSIKALKKFISLNPDREFYIKSLILLGQAYSHIKDYKGAANYYYEVIHRSPYKYPRVYLELSSILTENKLYDDAAIILKDLISHQSKESKFMSDAYISLGNIHYMQGHYKEALRAYQDGVNLIKDGSMVKDIKFLIADCMLKVKLRKQARKILMELVKNDSGLIKKLSQEKLKDIDLSSNI